ncbi:MAG: trigger factor family protein, partial [Deltaproteobacteria bacterium]|nr:trigger factor family protein [Deltaproteobacteria bacterium]
MSSTVNKINEVLIELKVTVPADKIKGIVDERLKKLTKTAKVRGFRKGKIPFGVAKRMFAPSLYIELVPDLSYEAFLAA